MLQKTLYFFFIPLLMSIYILQGAELEDLKIPKNRLLEWKPGIKDGIPEVPNKVIVKTKGSADCTDAIQKAIHSVKPPGAVLLPAGTYILKKPIFLKSGVVLRGQGMDKTHLKFMFDTEQYRAIVMSGTQGSQFIDKSQDDIPLASGYTPGSNQLAVAKSARLKPGQFVALICNNDKTKVWHTGRAEKYMKYHIVGQIFQIKQIKGRYLLLDQPVRISYFKKELKPKLRPLEMIKNAGIEDLHIWCNKNAGHIIYISLASQCWINNCHTAYSLNSHISVRMSRELVITGNYMHHAYGYGGGGQGYGVWLGFWTTDCLVENNVFDNLRHAMVVTLGSNGNVLSYNFSRRCICNCDISMHGFYSYMNLYEGNIVENVDYADFWGPVGPYNTCFRNRVTKGGI
jgi:hypothetical protein